MNGTRSSGMNSWADDRLASLDKGEEVMIEPAAILARLQGREQVRRKRQTRLIGAGIFAALTCGALAAVITTTRHETPKQEQPAIVPAAKSGDKAPQIVASPAPEPLPLEAKNNKPAKPPEVAMLTPPSAPSTSYKESGSLNASVTLEIYIDLECPPCATFYNQAMPSLIAEYVDTGKVKLLYRDFPMAQHKYADVAARYANAAGMIGKYGPVSEQIIQTQAMWKESGDVETQVAAVLSPDEMQRVRTILATSAEPDESISRDRAAGADDHIDQTPSMVLVAKGKRRKIAGAPPLPQLRNYLNELLAQQ
jgi:protein-disulfide isomerase